MLGQSYEMPMPYKGASFTSPFDGVGVTTSAGGRVSEILHFAMFNVLFPCLVLAAPKYY